MLDLNAHQIEWVINHLGHTLDVHKQHYRNTSNEIERTQIAKLLLIQDHGLANRFANVALEDIQLEGKWLNFLIDINTVQQFGLQTS